MNWITLQISACLIVTAVNSIYRQYGMSLKTLSLTILAVIVAQYCFGRSFQEAPTFFQPWFLGIVTLVLSGFVVSVVFFDGALSLRYYTGMVLAIGSCYLLGT